MTDRERLDALVDDIRSLLAKIEKAGNDGASTARINAMHVQARARLVELGDLHVKLSDEAGS